MTAHAIGLRRLNRPAVSTLPVTQQWIAAIGVLLVLSLVLAMPATPAHLTSESPVTPPARVEQPVSPAPAATLQGADAMSLAAQARISEQIGLGDPAYAASSTAGEAALRNPAHGVGASFDRSGATITAAHGDFGLQLSAIGRGERLAPVQPVQPSVSGNRIEYRRAGTTEFFVNGPAGIQHGFVVHEAPIGDTQADLTIEVGLTGSLHADSGGNDSVRFLDGKGNEAVRYEGLSVFDAKGQDLPAHMTLDGPSGLRFEIDDTAALYPVTVDPFVRTKTLGAGGQNQFGRGVDFDGDAMVIGAPGATVDGKNSQGEAFVFVKSGSGWASATLAGRLLASDGEASDVFGDSVAIDGDTIVVGARRNASSTGAVYVFEKPAAGWAAATETAKLAVGATNALLGTSVAIDGDTIVASAPGNDTAYLFEKPAGGWSGASATAGLASSGLASTAETVAISGATVVVGASSAQSYRGLVYVFAQPTGGWTDANPTATLSASDGLGGPSRGDNLGSSVDISGNKVIAGAPNDDFPGADDRGSAYVFVEADAGWADATQTAKLTASDGRRFDRFGSSVGIEGDTIVVGARNDDNPDNNSGSAYVFVKPSSGWANRTQNQKLGVSGTGSMGTSSAIADGVIAVGASSTNSFRGAAYVFEEPRADLELTKDCGEAVVLPGEQATCTLTIANHGPSDASSVVLADSLPNGLTLDGTPESNDGLSCTSDPLNCTLSSLGSGQQATVSYDLRVDPALSGGQELSNSATVQSSTVDPDPDNNSAQDTISVGDPQADLSISKDCGETAAIPGEPVTCTITASNEGPSNAAAIELSDTLPAGLTLQATPQSGDGFSCGAGNPIQCTLADLPAGQQASLDYQVIVDPATGPGQVFANTATVDSATHDQNTANNSTSEDIQVVECTISGSGSFVGTDGDDVLCGSPDNDYIDGKGGNDVIFAFEGHDILKAKGDQNWIFAGPGHDQVSTTGGDDTVRTGSGSDFVKTGNGNDTIYGGPGPDFVKSGLGDDYVDTRDGDGDDSVKGGGHNSGDTCLVDPGDQSAGCES